MAAAAGWQAASGAAPSDLDLPRVYEEAAAEPQPFIGPIAAVNIPGHGRGLVATSDLSAGQLLMVTPPLALVEGDFGELPEHDELQEVIAHSGATFSSWQAAWLTALMHDLPDEAGHSSSGTDGSSAALLTPAAVPDMVPPAEGLGQTAGVQFEGLGLSEDELWAAIVLNCYGEAYQDLPATLAAQAAPNSQLGLFGPFSLLNHSCSPNVVNYMLRRCMIARGVCAVPSGTEMTINYLGRGSLRPLGQRQLELQEAYGFSCGCARCRLEARIADCPTPSGSTIGTLLEQIHADIGNKWEPQLQELLRAKWEQQQEGKSPAAGQRQQDEDAVQQQLLQLVDDMARQWRDLRGAFDTHKSEAAGAGETRETARAWTEASVFDLLGLLHEAQGAAGLPVDEAAGAMLAACKHTCAGSDLHLFHALRLTSMEQQQQGPESEGAAAAQAQLLSVLAARYGPAVVSSEQLLQRMVAGTVAAAGLVSF